VGDTKLAEAQQALATYAQSGSEADLAKLRDMFGQDKLAAGGLERLYQGSPDALASLGGTARGAVTIGQLDLAAGGMDPQQLAGDLGISVDQLNTMSPDQFQQAVQDTLNRNLSSVDALKAEYRTASPQRQAQILEQLRQADASGLAASEAATSHLAESLDKAERVKFGGQDYNIQDLLKSDEVSNRIKDAASNPAALQQLQATDPDLAAWVTRNQASLKTFAEHNETQRTALEATQTQASALTANLTPALKSALQATGVALPTGTVTADQLTGLRASLQGNSLYQAIQADKSGAVKTALEAADDPAALAAKLKGLTPEQIAQSADAARQLTDPTLAKVLGVDASSGFVDPSQLASTQAALKDWAALPGDVQASGAFGHGLLTGPAGIAWAAQHQRDLANPELEALIQDGSVATNVALQHVVNHPEILSQIKQLSDEQTQVDALLAGDPNNGATQQSMKTLLFGSPIDFRAANSMLTAAAADHSMAGQAGYAMLKQLYDTDHDGSVSAKDFDPRTVRTRLSEIKAATPSAADLANGQTYTDPFASAHQAVAGALWSKYADAGAKRARDEAAASTRAVADKAAAQARLDLATKTAEAAKAAGELPQASTPAPTDTNNTKPDTVERVEGINKKADELATPTGKIAGSLARETGASDKTVKALENNPVDKAQSHGAQTARKEVIKGIKKLKRL
jgi:hypothetical protein